MLTTRNNSARWLTLGTNPLPRHAAHLDVTAPIEAVLAFGWLLVNNVDALAAQFADLGDLELPAPIHPVADQSQLQSVAPVYLAAELEAALVLPSVETLAGLFVSGGLPGDLGEAAALLYEFWQQRHERFVLQERQAFFARLFGGYNEARLATEGSYNTDFEPLMIELTDALYNLESNQSSSQRTRNGLAMRATATQMIENLIQRSGGITNFVARDLLRSTQAAIDVLKHPTIQQIVGARSVWMAVGNIARNYLHQSPPVSTHVMRGKSGMLVLSWLADSLPILGDPAAQLVSPEHPVIEAAATWLQTSLHIEEQRAPMHGEEGRYHGTNK